MIDWLIDWSGVLAKASPFVAQHDAVVGIKAYLAQCFLSISIWFPYRSFYRNSAAGTVERRLLSWRWLTLHCRLRSRHLRRVRHYQSERLAKPSLRWIRTIFYCVRLGAFVSVRPPTVREDRPPFIGCVRLLFWLSPWSALIPRLRVAGRQRNWEF